MRREGLTVTMVFLAESANYGEGIGNISTLKKMSRGNHEQYSYISRQAMRYNIVRQADWDQTPVDGKSGVVQFAPSAPFHEVAHDRQRHHAALAARYEMHRLILAADPCARHEFRGHAHEPCVAVLVRGAGLAADLHARPQHRAQ